jgi:predicted neutral ceramidase superfamily lipid hydrolase
VKSIKLISWFLGIAMFMFGILKVLIPMINGWYTVQMTNSGLGAYIPLWVGITGEIVVGSVLIFCLVMNHNFANKKFNIIIQLASAAILPMMATAIYVHLQPNVPAEVLPLKIKPPFIPVFFMLLALANIYLMQRKIKTGTN